MARIALNAEKRTVGTKSVMRTLRKSGQVPGVVYHRGETSLPVQLDTKVLFAVLHTGAGRNVLIDLKIKDDSKQRVVVVKELQQDPVSGNLKHVDFNQISLTEKIRVQVPVVEKGEAPGVKNEGGLLETPMRVLDIECLPTDIPEHIEIDISGLTLNKSIHVRDLQLPGNLRILNESDMVIVQVRKPEEEKPVVEGEEAAKEPEVINEKKKEEGEEGAAADPKKPEKAAEKDAGKK